MKHLRLFAAAYLFFLLWLFLFPPWTRHPYESNGLDPIAMDSIGHHWRFAVPAVNVRLGPFDRGYWKSDPPPEIKPEDAAQFAPIDVSRADPYAVVDFSLMLYEALLAAILGLLAFALQRELATFLGGTYRLCISIPSRWRRYKSLPLVGQS